METKILLKELKEIEILVSQWKDEAVVPDIEKDIVLGKISKIYSLMKFPAESEARPAVMDFSPAADREEKQEVQAVPEYTATQEIIPEPEVRPGQVTEFSEENFPEAQKNTRPDAEPTFDNEAKEAIEDTDIPSDTVAAERPRTDKAKLRSLYDDDSVCRPLSSVNKPAISQASAVSEPGTESEISDNDLFAAKPVAIIETTVEKRVLGEVISGNGGTPINELLGSQRQQQMDVASKIYSKKVVTSIRQSLGVNDRFQLIRDLFGGDADMYSETIVTLDGFDDLDDALLYINDNFDWDPESQSVAILVDLLEHKLGL